LRRRPYDRYRAEWPDAIRSDSIWKVNSASLLRRARRKAGLSQRALAARAETSHTTLASYESATKVPRVDTLDRILRAAGFELEVVLSPRPDAELSARVAKGRELFEALELAAHFPVRRRAKQLPAPVIRRATVDFVR